MTCQFSLSYRDLEERGAKIDHAMFQRWVIRFVPLIDEAVTKGRSLKPLFLPLLLHHNHGPEQFTAVFNADSITLGLQERLCHIYQDINDWMQCASSLRTC